MRMLLLMVLGAIKGIMFLFLLMIILALFLAGGVQYFLVGLGVYLFVTILFTALAKGIKANHIKRRIIKMEEEEYRARMLQEVRELYGPFGSRRYIPPTR